MIKSKNQPECTLNWVHSGQYRPYGDTFKECEIHTNDSMKEKDLLLLVNNGSKLPKVEWDKHKFNSAAVYFQGWYTLEKTYYGYKYVGCEPYTD